MKEFRDRPRPTMSDEEMVKDYPRLAREYALLHQDYRKAIRKPLNIPNVSDCFSFARYLNENFHYFDNTDVGDAYKDNNGQGLYSEKDIYDEWLNNR